MLRRQPASSRRSLCERLLRKQLKCPLQPNPLCIFLDERIGPVGLSVCRVEVFSGTRIAGFRHDYCRWCQVFFDKERHVTTPQRQMPTVITLSSEQVSEPSRRQFCAHACQAASLVAVSALLPACGGGGDAEIQRTRRVAAAPRQALPVINATVSGRTVSVSVSGSLANPGSAALVQASSVQPNVFLVFRDSTAAFTVLTAVCTHEGCTVDSFNGQLLHVPLPRFQIHDCRGSCQRPGQSRAPDVRVDPVRNHTHV